MELSERDRTKIGGVTMGIVYNDEDNAPMNDENWDRIDVNGHNPTVYTSYSEMKAIESGLPFDDPKPDNGCWNCQRYNWDHEACTIGWNNYDEDYYNPDIDDRKPDDWCEEFELDPDVKPEDFGGNEP